MLQIQNISKQYRTGELVQTALNQVSLNLRSSEFVSILGPSGSGKTTLLNIIGGLDRYDSGDVRINGVSTKQYKDRDWDSYRNHTIGFVFQSYNLIPHQSVLANVELALTIGGIRRKERRQRARRALEEVGLGDQLHKGPNQLSGGQMQRVAIARALVNDPDILLADEPTGALDTETSVQVMELLAKVAKNRLVVMVTHNPELAQRYSTRIVRLRDGTITDDSDPYQPDGQEQQENGNRGRATMSFGTALSLSFHNLRTKKGRTVLTAFAGSIGIIGIALILALSSGVNDYIVNIQRDTMTAYPVTISAEALDLSGMQVEMHLLEQTQEAADGVHADYSLLEQSEAMADRIVENNLTALKQYLDDPDSEIQPYLGENGVVYRYDVGFFAYSYDTEGDLVRSDADLDKVGHSTMPAGAMAGQERMRAMITGDGTSGAENFSELMPGTHGTVVSPILTDSYQVLYGRWPETYQEAVLVLNEKNGIQAGALYQLGLITAEEYEEITGQIQDGQQAAARDWDYAEICDHRFTVLPASAHYVRQEDGTFRDISEDSAALEQALEHGVELRITGVIRPQKDAANASIATPVAYTAKLTDYLIAQTDTSEVVQAQEATPERNVLTGLNFEAPDDAAKAEAAKTYLSSLGISDKAAFYTMMMAVNARNNPDGAGQMAAGPAMDETAAAAALDAWLAGTPDPDVLTAVYHEYIDGASYKTNMEAFGKASYDAPASISIYTDSFEDKEAVSACIERYNEGKSQEEKITYTDYVALLTGSITSMVNAISYVLIAFVAVSLIVSSIMIGIITHISVLERTKEIGILRAMGASKQNISQVFNAETVLIGLLAGLLGVGVSELLTIPINALIQHLLEEASLAASLPFGAALVLVILSVAITVIAGWIPAKRAAKKDPVLALRSE